MHYDKDFGIECRIARFHNIYGPYGTWKGGREKAPAAICRKVIDAIDRKDLRIKIWGTARVVEDDPALLEELTAGEGTPRGEQAIVFTVGAWDSNCPQHIPQRFEAADVAAALSRRDRRIAALEAEIAQLRGKT